MCICRLAFAAAISAAPPALRFARKPFVHVCFCFCHQEKKRGEISTLSPHTTIDTLEDLQRRLFPISSGHFCDGKKRRAPNSVQVWLKWVPSVLHSLLSIFLFCFFLSTEGCLMYLLLIKLHDKTGNGWMSTDEGQDNDVINKNEAFSSSEW